MIDHQCPNKFFDYPQRQGRSSLPQEGAFLEANWDRVVARTKALGLEKTPSIEDRTLSTFSRGEVLHARGSNTFLKALFLEDIRNGGEYMVERIAREAPLCGLKNESWSL